MYFFLPSFCPFCFSSFCLFPIFFCFVSDSGVFLPALLAVLFFLFQKIFSFSFPAFCRTSFRSSCLHHPSALNRFVCPALQGLYRLFTFRSCRSFSAKTFLSEIPSFRSLQSLSHANITISPKTDLSENPSQFRTVFPADLLLHLYFLSLSRCFRFLVYKCSFSLISPFSSSLASFFFPCGLALAPLAFSLRLSVLKNFPILIYINEMTLSTIFRDKTMFPNLFSSKLGASPLFQPVFSLAIDQDISLRPCFSYAPKFCAPSLNLLFAVSAEKVSSHQYKDLRPFPIIMRKRKFFSRRHKAKSLASKPP